MDAETLISVSADQTAKVWTIEAAALAKSERLSNLSLDKLTRAGCEWLGDYLRHNPDDQADAHLCHKDQDRGLYGAIMHLYWSFWSQE